MKFQSLLPPVFWRLTYVLTKRALRVIKQRLHLFYRRQRDARRTTYSRPDISSQARFHSCFDALPIGLLRSHTRRIISMAEQFIAHRFDLLGSRYTPVSHGKDRHGTKGHGNDMNRNGEPDRSGRWLKARINTANVQKSQKIWQTIYRVKPTMTYMPIDWQLDFKSNHRWSENTWYKDIHYGDKPGVDVKVPWEMARMQHLPQLALAYALSKQENNGQKAEYAPQQYAMAFRNQVLDFMATNPPRWGANWETTMEVGIRVANWLFAYDRLIAHGAEFDFEPLFASSVYDHGLHIMNNLEYSEVITSNHYLSNIAGMLWAAVYLPRTKKTEKWLIFAVHELKREMDKQVYPDGTDFEASTCYHRLVLELFFYSSLLAVKKNDRFQGQNYPEACASIFGKGYSDRLYRMFDAVFNLIKPNGRMPQIGDNDSGQFLKLFPREVLDMRYLLALGAIFFQEPKWRLTEFFQEDEDIAEVLIACGKTGSKTWNALQPNSLSTVSSRSFPDSGWYIMRGESVYCMISCGPNGQNDWGGHCHNDKLSFELNVSGEDIIVDPGTYVYTSDPESRNDFRSTASHNTVVVDGLEQNRLNNLSLFYLENDTRARCLKWESDTRQDLFLGEHQGYSRLNNPVVHRRKILFHKLEKEIIINDSFFGKGKHRFEWYFHFSPGVAVHLTKNNALTIKTASGEKITLLPETTEDGLQIDLFDGWFSPEYGKREKAMVVKYTMECKANHQMGFRLTL